MSTTIAKHLKKESIMIDSTGRIIKRTGDTPTPQTQPNVLEDKVKALEGKIDSFDDKLNKILEKL